MKTIDPSAHCNGSAFSRRGILGALLGGTALTALPFPGMAAARRPNIITIVLDDVGYSDLGCFGGEIKTPNIDRLARRGLRFTHFDTKAVCSATRAALLTGRNCHTVNMPDVPNLASLSEPGDLPRDAFHMPRNAQHLAEALKQGGYSTWTIGKWHLAPADQMKPGTSRENWPLHRGFDYFYGFPSGWTDQYRPDLVEGDDYIDPELPEDYHLSVDLVDKALGLIERNRAGRGKRPFYLNLAFGAAHAPIQVPREYSLPYDETYSVGWDEIRWQRFQRMKRMGLIPPETRLPARNEGDRSWAELSEDERVVFTRYMSVYAGFLQHADEQIGRLLDALETGGMLDNTVIVLISDNGAASEAGQAGEFDGLYKPNTLTPAEQRARLDELGTGKTQAEYPRPWAMAGVTPLRRYKVWPFSGGTRTPMVVHWPGRVTDPGAIRRQFVDVVDIAPTLLEAAGLNFAAKVGGVPQIPVAGRSFAPVLADAGAAPTRTVQYFELRGHRAITDGNWRAVAMHVCGQPYEQDHWQLFDLGQDFSEAIDLADRFPDRLQAMQQLWDAEWRRYSPHPLLQPGKRLCGVFTRTVGD